MPIFTQTPDLLATTVTGSAGNDVLAGSDGNDLLIGGAGDDLFFEGRGPWEQPSTGPFVQGQTYGFGFGSDTFRGGSGQDTLSFAGSSPAIALQLAADGSGFLARQGDIDSFSGIETFILGAGADSVYGGGSDQMVNMGGGNDEFLFRLAHNTTVDGGGGTDTFNVVIAPAGTIGPIIVNLTTGRGPQGMVLRNFENITVSATADYALTGNAIRNTLVGGNGDDVLFGAAGNDVLIDGDGDDRLYGGADDDTLNGTVGRDSLYGGAGDDRLLGGEAAGFDPQELWGGVGHDTIIAGPSFALIYGGAGNDRISGASRFIEAFGGDGDDHMTGASNNDTLEGDDGNDRLFGGFGDDLFYGGNGSDFISGGNGNDEIFGGRGADTLRGAQGNDTLIAEGDVAVTLYGDTGDDRLTLTNGEGYGGEGRDTLISQGGGQLFGGNGSDLFQLARAFSITASGGAGDDRFELTGDRTGPFAQQVLFGGDGIDSLHVEEGSVQLRSDVLFGGNAGVVAYGDIESITFGAGRIDLLVESGVTGGFYTLNGANSSARLIGNNSNVIFNGTGNTAILEGVGTTVLSTGSGRDTVTIRDSAGYAGVTTGAGADTVFLHNASSTVNTGAGADVMTVQSFIGSFPSGNINMGSGNDSLTLLCDFREIALGSGDDTLFIGEGAQSDLLTAGAGADTFVIDPDVTGATIQVLDFALGQDRISRPDATSLADVDTITEDAGTVRLFFRSDSPFAGETQGTVIYLQGLTIAQLTDDIFL